MAHTVFICHSRKDKFVADAACAALEAHRIRCWIAPRDVLGGSEWGAEIVDAISSCKVVVLIFSSNANESAPVRREVECALSEDKIVVPFRTENIQPSGSLKYALLNRHWLDAIDPPMERRLAELCNTISRLTRPEPVAPQASEQAEREAAERARIEEEHRAKAIEQERKAIQEAREREALERKQTAEESEEENLRGQIREADALRALQVQEQKPKVPATQPVSAGEPVKPGDSSDVPTTISDLLKLLVATAILGGLCIGVSFLLFRYPLKGYSVAGLNPFYEKPEGQPLVHVAGQPKLSLVQILDGYADGVRFGAGSDRLLVSSGNYLSIVNVQTTTNIAPIQKIEDAAMPAAVSQDQKLIAYLLPPLQYGESGSQGNQHSRLRQQLIKVRSLVNLKISTALSDPLFAFLLDANRLQIDIDPQSKLLATAVSQNASGVEWSGAVWDLVKHKELYKFIGSRVRFSPVRNLLVVATNGSINIMDAQSGLIRQSLPTKEPFDIEFSSDGQYLAAHSFTELDVWKTDTWTLTNTINLSPFYKPKFAFSPDAKFLFLKRAGSLDIWSLNSGRPVERIRENTSEISLSTRAEFSLAATPYEELSISPTGNLLASLVANKVWIYSVE